MNAQELWICGKLYEFSTYPQLLLLLLSYAFAQKDKEEEKD
jgi:hypothetical protein